MGVEHSQLEIKDWFARHREIEMTRLNGSGVDWSYWYLKDTFAQSGAVDVTFSLEGWQDGLDGEVFAQGTNFRPIVMQGDAAGIRVSNGFQSKPVLNLALLPVRGRQLGGQRGKLKTVGAHRRSHNQILSAALLFKNIVVEENPLD
jgi:hypothetical protein